MEVRKLSSVQAMAMQTAVVYGRLIASHTRQFVAPLLKRQSSSKLQLITASCGFSKDLAPGKSKFLYGEDAFFIANNSASDVLGKICFQTNRDRFVYGWQKCVHVELNLAYVTHKLSVNKGTRNYKKMVSDEN